jgi:hypothetical protein
MESIELSSYQQYKFDTAQFILWLIKTAQSLEHPIRSPKPFDRALKSPKTKALEGDDDDPIPMSRYPLSTEQILELAKFIRAYCRHSQENPQDPWSGTVTNGAHTTRVQE